MGMCMLQKIVPALLFVAALACAPTPALAEVKPPLTPDHRERVQAVIRDLVAQGETDVDELVKVIAADSYEKLDHIVINVANQRIYECNIAGQALREPEKISSGRGGYDTPLGTYKLWTKSIKAYSRKYDAWMLHWLGFTSDGNYGIHGLEGSSYERHLGSVASHGCIRVSRTYAKDLFTRAERDMLVKVVNDPELKIETYKPISHAMALNMVLEVLSPADPWEIFY